MERVKFISGFKNQFHTCTRLRYSLKVKEYDNNRITLNINGVHNISYNNVFLRDSCQSEESVDSFSKQKLFNTSQVYKRLAIKLPPTIVDNLGEESLKITWDQNGREHVSIYPKSFLLKYSNQLRSREGKFFEKDMIDWSNEQLEENINDLQFDYLNYLSDDKEFDRSLKILNKFGILFVNNIPKTNLIEMNEENALEWPVASLASKFGYIKKTFYGTLFNVKTEKEAKNIANTTDFLPLHMDLLYYESPPGLQLLHFLKNSTLGGENIFSDSFAAAEYVKKVDPDAYHALKIIPITYHYDNNNEYYYYSRPLVIEEKVYSPEEGTIEVIKEVNYSPPFQGPFEVGISQEANNTTKIEVSNTKLFEDFLRGFEIFEAFVCDPKNQYTLKMKEGTCVVFNNRRVLHSRNLFSNSNNGERWLMGCYVDGDSYRSKLRISYRNSY